MKDRRRRQVKRRDPVARVLRDPLFRARRERSRKKYSRKAKHRGRDEPDPKHD